MCNIVSLNKIIWYIVSLVHQWVRNNIVIPQTVVALAPISQSLKESDKPVHQPFLWEDPMQPCNLAASRQPVW